MVGLVSTPWHRLSLMNALGWVKAVLANDRCIAPTNGVTMNIRVMVSVGSMNSYVVKFAFLRTWRFLLMMLMLVRW